MKSKIKSPPKLPFLCLASLSVILTLCGSFPAEANVYELGVEGDLTYRSKMPAHLGGKVFEEGRQFSFRSSGCSWLIRLTPVLEKFPADFEHVEVAYDGTDVYEIWLLSRDPQRGLALRQRVAELGVPEFPRPTNALPRSAARNDAVGLVYPGKIPAVTPARETAVWLAYGSSCYFATNAPGFAVQMWESDLQRLPYTNLVKAAWNTTGGSMPFLTNLIYYLRARGTKAEGAQWLSQPHVVFSVSEVTNIAGLTLPMAFKLTRYSELGDGELVYEVTARARAVTARSVEGPAKQLRPDIGFPTRVEDHRLPGTPLIYFVTNGVWVPDRELSNLEEFKREMRVAKAQRKVSPGRAMVTALSVTLALGVPLLLVQMVRIKGRTSAKAGKDSTKE